MRLLRAFPESKPTFQKWQEARPDPWRAAVRILIVSMCNRFDTFWWFVWISIKAPTNHVNEASPSRSIPGWLPIGFVKLAPKTFGCLWLRSRQRQQEAVFLGDTETFDSCSRFRDIRNAVSFYGAVRRLVDKCCGVKCDEVSLISFVGRVVKVDEACFGCAPVLCARMREGAVDDESNVALYSRKTSWVSCAE
jgi:hypothetical protein